MILEAVCPGPDGDTPLSLGDPPFLPAIALFVSSLTAFSLMVRVWLPVDELPDVPALFAGALGISFKEIGSNASSAFAVWRYKE